MNFGHVYSAVTKKINWERAKTMLSKIYLSYQEIKIITREIVVSHDSWIKSKAQEKGHILGNRPAEN